MGKRIDETPLIGMSGVLKGIISGALISGGLFNPAWGLPTQAFLIISGVLVFIESTLEYGRPINTGTAIMALIISGALTFSLSVLGAALWFVALMFIAGCFMYIPRLYRRISMPSQDEDVHETVESKLDRLEKETED